MTGNFSACRKETAPTRALISWGWIRPWAVAGVSSTQTGVYFMKRFRNSRSVVFIECVEPRLLFATTWGAQAKLTEQDLAASQYSSINGKGVTVAVIDSGIDYNLSSLGGGFGAGHKVVAGYDFADGDPDPMDTDGH